MSWSLAIVNGDLSFNGASITTTSGSEKLVQDLACCILEPMGTDDMHPGFGSLIDGGTAPDGTFNTGIIGHLNDQYAAVFVTTEVERICKQYQVQQQARYQADVGIYGKATLTASEALLSVSDITTIAAQDKLLVNATLQTGNGNLALNLPISPA